jgi:two-component system, OmpR family, phosphate regulon sensor histidine kinase PhoR
MLASMELPFIIAIALLAFVVPIAIWLLVERDRTLAAVRSAITRDGSDRPLAEPRGASRSTDRPGRPPARWAPYDPIAEDPAADLPTLVRRLRERLDASELELDQQIRNASYLADVMGMGIVRIDERGRVELANAAAHSLLRRPAGTLRGHSTVEAFVDNRVENVISTAFTSGGASGEFRLGGTDGPIVVVRARTSPTGGVWVVLEDVSELRRLQQIRTEFVDNLSHELRTPLSTVSLLAETLAREAEAAGDGVPPKMRDRIAKIEVETGHLVQMVNELLDLARIEGGGPMTLMDDVDLGRIAQEAADRLRLFAERQGLRLIVDVPARLPPVRGDEARLGQVIVNLVHNALKFSRPAESDDDPFVEPEGVSDEVRVTVREIGDQVILAVEDHGVGIPKADQDRIFERFYKVDRARVRGGGTGLGLAIARHVVEQHGGRIRVESEEGRGSIFTVALPVASRAPAAVVGV